MGLGSAPLPSDAGGGGGYSTFLKAQESSPTLVLAHAGIGDKGVLEVAHFLAGSPCLVRLDLTGCGITSEGLLHLAEALRLSVMLESLVLRHNAITSGPAGEAGLAALCHAVHDSPSMRHLDLRHCGLSGPAAAGHVGGILQGNQKLSHLELSWNSLGPSAGQVLLDNIRATSGLFDCQLTGCRLAEETLLDIAQFLLRNRKVHSADLLAGPYKGSWTLHSSEYAQRRDLAILPSALRSQGEASAQNWAARSVEDDVPGNQVVSRELTEEYMCRLVEWRRMRNARCSAKEQSRD
ncbi:unnamed protein product, partial [Polarella glacialis]